MTIYQKLSEVQQQINVPKKNYNSFGKYYYRSAEDILEAAKPILKKVGLVLTLSDNIVNIGTITNGDTSAMVNYVESTATIYDVETGESLSVKAYAKEDVDRKGMDSPQITGSASSYARKYALNGIFALNDAEDSDSTNTHEVEKPKVKEQPKIKEQPKTKEQPAATLATKEQLNKIYELAKKHNYEEGIAKYIQTAFNKKTSKELTVFEADEILKILLSLGK